jgi:aerobic carbon-monoxide dehydrogenase large subunit
VRIEHHDTTAIGEGGGSFSSRSTMFAGNAVIGAVADLCQRARTAGARAMGIAPEEVEVLAGGIVRERGRPEHAQTFHEVDCEGRFRYEKRTRFFGMGGAVAVVRVDLETGGVRLERCVVACDVGRAINPLLVDAQVVGAAAQGIGGALLEEFAYDAAGPPQATSFMDYCLPTAAETSTIEAVVMESAGERTSPTDPLIVHGAGEVGVIGVGAAIANAVADALGPDGPAVRRLPIRPDLLVSRSAGTSAAVETL